MRGLVERHRGASGASGRACGALEVLRGGDSGRVTGAAAAPKPAGAVENGSCGGGAAVN